MAKRSAALLLTFLLAAGIGRIVSADPDPVEDFCVPDSGELRPDPARLASYRCKSPSNVTVNDFVFSGARSPGEFAPGTEFSRVAVTPSLFPGLNTLGMSFVRADFGPGGVNPPHYHPRATETALVVEGAVYSGFVDSGGRVFARVVTKGEVMVFPRGLVHFQMNVRDSPATIFGSLNSENPGAVGIPSTVFGSGIDEEVLEKAFGLSRKELERLRKKFSE